MFSSLSIRKKLIVITISSIMIATVLSASIILYTETKAAEEVLVANIEAHAKIASANSATALLLKRPRDAAEILHSLSIEAAIQGAKIYDLENKVFAEYKRRADVWPNSSQLPSDATRRVNKDQFDVIVPITYNGDDVGSLMVTASKSGLFISLMEHVVVATIIFLLVGLFAYIWSIRLQKYISRPVEHILSVTREVRSGNNYSVRVNKYYDDELGLLADDFNLMLTQIEQRDQDLEKQVSDRTQELEKRNHKLASEMRVRVKAQAKLHESEKRFRSTFANAAIGMILLDRKGHIIQVNNAVCNMLGYDVNELQRMSIYEVMHVEDRDMNAVEREKLLNGEIDHFRAEKRYLRKDGDIIWGLSTISGVFDKNGEFLYAISQVLDITEEYRLSKELSYQATHDVLTGLLNRREFESRIQKAWERSRDNEGVHVLCYIDLDQFKVINDTCGHIAGDEMLRQIAALLQEHVRKHDSIARLGGDEFGILMEFCSMRHGLMVTRNLRKQIEQLQFVWEDNRFKVAASMGVVEINGQSSSVVELLKQADSACFAAKDDGRNRVNVYRSEDAAVVQRRGEMQWVHRIQEAIDEDRLILYSQPIVPTDSQERGLHMEVLVRLLSKEGEEVPPGAFLPAAERYGLATNIDKWVVNHVFNWMQDNRDYVQNHVNVCAINLSGLTLSDDTFLNTVIDELYARDISAEKLCFEITETALIANLSQATSFIRALRRLGCKFALDDFGSGLSSFAYLKNLQVDYLKIDGMFVRDMIRDPIDYALVRSINEMGKVMGKKTIAEFVETKEIFAEIKKLGIDYAQGYGVGAIEPLLNLNTKPEELHKNDAQMRLRVVK